MGAVAAVLLLGACGGGEDRPGQASSGKCGNASGSASVSGSSAADEGPFKATEATTKVAVTLHDYMFDGIPATLKGPRIYFDAKVTGSNCHEMEVLGSDGKAVGEIPAFPSTEKKHLALELKPGTYTVQCLVKEGAKTHADLGMKTQFVVE
jgi:hypothetical protein